MTNRQILQDAVSFEKIFREYDPGLLFFVGRHLGDRELAKDIVQDVFYKLYESADQFPEDFNIKSSLFRVSGNTAMDYIRHFLGYFGDYLFQTNGISEAIK